MARIRSIKPEFPQSETIGALSRDARLLFIQLWTIVDDAGRARAASRMLASLLFPYDDDAPSLIEGWLTELEQAACIRRYEVEGSRYLDVPNWLKHQKIDKPSGSKIPEFVEASRVFAEASPPDLGPRTVDLGGGEGSEADASGGEPPPADPIEALWAEGVPALKAMGATEKEARTNIGRWRRDGHDPPQLLAAILQARDTGSKDPIPLVSRILKPAPARYGKPNGTPLNDAFEELRQTVRRAEAEPRPVLAIAGR